MGEKGKLTQIDFSKSYVVVVTKLENEFETVLKPIDVVQIHNEIIQVNYSVEIVAK